MVEGVSLVSLAHESGWEIEALFLRAGTVPEALDVPAGLARSTVPVFELGDGVMERVVSTETGPPLVATVRIRVATIDALASASLVLVGDKINDPGNAGTMLRSAEAAGADVVVFTDGSVDVFNPKVVRSSAGALFAMPVVVDVTLADVSSIDGLRTLGTTSHADAGHSGEVTSYLAVDLTGRTAIVVGNEAHGLAADAPVDGWVSIPHAGRAESLNVAMAATVLVFEAARQRRAAAGTV